MKLPSIASLAMVMALVASSALTSIALEDSQLRSRDEGKSQEVRQHGSFKCLLLEGDGLYPAGGGIFERKHEPFWSCQDERLLLYEIIGPGPEFFKDENAISGHDFIRVSEAKTVRNSRAGDRLEIAPGSQVRIFRDDERRRLAPRIGNNTLLVIRGISLDGAPTKTAAELADDVFGVKGGGNDRVNLVTQYNACSKGALQYNPATGNTNITNGVVEVSVRYNLNGVNWMTAYNYFATEAVHVVGSLSQWTQVMFIMQSTVDYQGTLARGYLNSWQTIYMDSAASNLMIQMHELGHNLGMQHSGEGLEESGDSTCMMGTNQFYYDDAHLQCFNAAKSWFLGWYADRQITVTPTTSSWEGSLAGVDDYVQGQTTEGEHYVVVKIENTISSTDLYMMYNKQEGVNSGVLKYPNNVIIVRADNGVASNLSSLVSNLSAGQVYRASNFSGQAADLVVKVCDMVEGTPDFARVVVYLDNSVDNLSCPTSAPTVGPTAAPNAAPNAAPTVAPTTNPTAAPTAGRTAGPTTALTAIPTADPTTNPTSAPTVDPTAASPAPPPAAPTAAPTTRNPTPAPTTRSPTPASARSCSAKTFPWAPLACILCTI